MTAGSTIQVVRSGQHRDDALGRLGLDALHPDHPTVRCGAQPRDIDSAPREVEILAIERAKLTDAQALENQRCEYDRPRNIVAPSHGLRDPNLAAAALRDEAVRDVVVTGERNIGIRSRERRGRRPTSARGVTAGICPLVPSASRRPRSAAPIR